MMSRSSVVVYPHPKKYYRYLKKFYSIYRRIKENFVYIIATHIFRQDKIVLLSSSDNDKFGNITALSNELCAQGIQYILLTHKQLKNNVYKYLIFLAKARIIVIDAESPSARIKLNNNTYLIHCWHACGAYKKIGFDAKRKNYNNDIEEKRIKRIHSGISWFVCTSEETAKIYAKALRLPLERMLIIGSPRLDNIIQKDNFSLPKTYTILYAPTYRTYGKNNRYLPTLPDANILREKLISKLGENVHLVFRGHPTTPSPVELNGWEDWSDLPQSVALYQASVLITDYSSIFFDFLIFKRPIVFYIPDIEVYIKNERGLYFLPNKEFKETICVDTNSLVNVLIKCRDLKINYNKIWNKYMSSCDGNSSNRLCNFIKKIMIGEI